MTRQRSINPAVARERMAVGTFCQLLALIFSPNPGRKVWQGLFHRLGSDVSRTDSGAAGGHDQRADSRHLLEVLGDRFELIGDRSQFEASWVLKTGLEPLLQRWTASILIFPLERRDPRWSGLRWGQFCHGSSFLRKLIVNQCGVTRKGVR